MTRARPMVVAAGLCAAAALLSRAPAHAAVPGEWLLAAGGGYAHARAQLPTGVRWAPGWQLGGEAQYGVSETWSLRAAVHASWHPVNAQPMQPGGHVRTVAGTAGAVYAVDVLRVVPFAELGLSVLHLGQAVRDPGVFLGLQLGAGAAYLIDRRWSLAGVLRFQHFTLALGDTDQPAPLLLGALVMLARSF